MKSQRLHHSPSVLLPRHYYQVALDFKRLSSKIAESCEDSYGHALATVKNPAVVLQDWDSSFQQYVRPLAKIFHTLSTQVLAKSHSLKLIDTVEALVPLEQQVFRLLALREMVGRHLFPQRWRRGQALFLSRIDKILKDLQGILQYFNSLIQRDQTGSSGTCHYVWDKEIECTTQTRAFNKWCLGMGCVISPAAPLTSVFHGIAQYWSKGVSWFNRPKIIISGCNS